MSNTEIILGNEVNIDHVDLSSGNVQRMKE